MLFLTYTPKLTHAELEVYRYLSTNIEKSVFMTIQELADETHLSKSAIWRFCKKFECTGYTDFRFKLKEHLKNQKKGFLIQSTDETVLINFFKRSLEEAIDSKIKQAASVLAEKELIIFLGNATSKSIAEFGALHFTSFVCLANHVPFPYLHPTIELSKEFAEKIAVIVLSVSGESKRVVNNLKRFLENGVTTISITNSEKSPVAMMSDINISYYISKEQNKGADLTSQIPALFIIEKLAKLVHAKKRGQ